MAGAQGQFPWRIREATPLDETTDRLQRPAMAIGAEAEGAVRSNARKALLHGASPEDLRAVAPLAITTCGFPTAVAGLRWLQEVLDAQDRTDTA